MTTILLIKEAIIALKERTGSSVIAINKYIEGEKKISVKKHVMRAALKKAVETGTLTMVKNSYKLTKPISQEVKETTAKAKEAKPKKATTKIATADDKKKKLTTVKKAKTAKTVTKKTTTKTTVKKATGATKKKTTAVKKATKKTKAPTAPPPATPIVKQ